MEDLKKATRSAKMNLYFSKGALGVLVICFLIVFNLSFFGGIIFMLQDNALLGIAGIVNGVLLFLGAAGYIQKLDKYIDDSEKMIQKNEDLIMHEERVRMIHQYGSNQKK